jgi:hypothetical protein
MAFIEEGYIAGGLVSASCESFRFDGGACGGSHLRGNRCRDVECREKGRKDLDMTLVTQTGRWGRRESGLVELLVSRHDLCGS